MDEQPADELLSDAEILAAVHEVMDRNPRATVQDVGEELRKRHPAILASVNDTELWRRVSPLYYAEVAAARGNDTWNRVGMGVSLLFMLHVLQVPMYLVAVMLFCRSGDPLCGISGLLVPANIGITQWVYVIPTVLILWRRRNFNQLKGIVIGATVILLLNGTCLGILWASSQPR
jgi:hypothetical protein